MEERAVCYYCATVYPAEQEKCPLCGSTKRSEDFVIPQRRERITEAERKRRQRGGKYAAPKTSSKSGEKKAGKNGDDSNTNRKYYLIGALIFLGLAALVLFWFIADMLGWFPGLENAVERETQAGVSVNVGCTELLAEPARLTFDTVGQSLELTVSVNLSCEEKLYCTSNDPAVAAISDSAVTAEGQELKSATFTVTSVAEGTTAITVSCGNQTMGIPVAVTSSDVDGGTTDPTGNFIPELNWQEIEFTTMEESVTLKVANLPAGATVIWMSGNESVATVDAQGVVKPVATGQTTITCDVDGSTAQVTIRCDIAEQTTNNNNNNNNNNNDEGAHLESTDVTVDVGDKFPLYLYNSKSEHIDDISYVVDNAAICEVVDNYVRALSEGTTKIRVIYGDQEFVCIVRVG